MKVREVLSVNFSDMDRRVLNHYHGIDGLATREKCKDHLYIYGAEMGMELLRGDWKNEMDGQDVRCMSQR